MGAAVRCGRGRLRLGRWRRGRRSSGLLVIRPAEKVRVGVFRCRSGMITTRLAANSSTWTLVPGSKCWAAATGDRDLSRGAGSGAGCQSAGLRAAAQAGIPAVGVWLGARAAACEEQRARLAGRTSPAWPSRRRRPRGVASGSLSSVVVFGVALGFAWGSSARRTASSRSRGPRSLGRAWWRPRATNARAGR